MDKRLHLIYSGRVQGVGFRYAVMDIARRQNIVGWVKNLDDGRVEIIAQSGEATLNNFIQEINQQFTGSIKDLDTQWLSADLSAGKSPSEFSDFRIKF